jgi:uncharacterized protein YcfJ
MKKFKIAIFMLSAALSSMATARHQDDTSYARVVSAQPVYEQVARSIPHEQCSMEQVRYDYPSYQRPSATGVLLGGMLGAAMGHQIGRDKSGKKIGRVAGALLGASIGSDASRRSAPPARVEYRDEERCSVEYSTEYANQLAGYNVTYEYGGKMYQTRMDHHPGLEIRVAVDVRPY